MRVFLDINTEAIRSFLDQESRISFDRYLRGEITRDALMEERGWNEREFSYLLLILVDAAIKRRYNHKRLVSLD